MLLLLRLIADLQSFLYMQVLQWFAPFLFPGTQADHLLSSSKKDYWSKITRIKSLFIWGQCMLQVENPGSTSMSKAQMNSTDAYESLKGDGRKTDTALWVAENKTEFTWKWVTKGKRKWDFYAFKQTIWFIPAYCMFSSFQVLEPHETAKIRHDRQGLSAQHAPLAGWHETFWFCSNVTKYIVGWKSYRWRPWNSCNLLSLSLSLSQLSQLYIHKEKTFHRLQISIWRSGSHSAFEPTGSIIFYFGSCPCKRPRRFSGPGASKEAIKVFRNSANLCVL